MAEARQTRRALLGFGIIGGLFALAVAIFLLDDVLAALRPTYRIVVVLPDAPGLKAGSPVWVGGREVGSVLAIQFRAAGGDSVRLLLDLELPASVREQVRRDSQVRITSASMIGDPVVDVLPGTAAAPLLADGDTLVPRPRPDAAEITRRATALRADADSLRAAAAALEPLVASRRAGLAVVERHLAASSREYDALMREVERSPALALLDGEQVADVTARLEEVLQELSGALERQQQALQESGAQQNAARLQERAAEVRSALAGLQDRLQDGTLDRMARDSALVHALARARAELDSLLAEVRRNPLRFAL